MGITLANWAMSRFSNLAILLPFLLPPHAQVAGSRTDLVHAQDPAPAHISSEQIPRHSVPQNAPCGDQPRSRKELGRSFQKGLFPLPSQITGTWVEIGHVSNYPSSRYSSLSCSGEKRGREFEFGGRKWLLCRAARNWDDLFSKSRNET